MSGLESGVELGLKNFFSRLALLIFFYSTACSSVQKSSDLRVIGGDDVENSDGPLVYIRGCSAVLVSPFQLLTAGHCVERYPTKSGFTPQIEAEQELEVVAYGGRTFNGSYQRFQAKVVAAKPHPTWTQQLNKVGDPNLVAINPEVLDLALITLDGNLPIVPAALNSKGVRAGQELLLMGTGCASWREAGGTWENLRQAPLKIESVSKLKFELGIKRANDGEKKAGACTGDSGGGTFVLDGNLKLERAESNRWVLAGINSVVAAPKNESEVFEARPLTAIRVDTESVAKWLRSLETPKPSRLLSDSEPQTPYEALNRARKSVRQSDDVRREQLQIIVKSSPQRIRQVSDAELKKVIEMLIDPRNNGLNSAIIVNRFFRLEEPQDSDWRELIYQLDIMRGPWKLQDARGGEEIKKIVAASPELAGKFSPKQIDELIIRLLEPQEIGRDVKQIVNGIR